MLVWAAGPAAAQPATEPEPEPAPTAPSAAEPEPEPAPTAPSAAEPRADAPTAAETPAPARATATPAATPSMGAGVTRTAAPAERRTTPWVGTMVDVGVPDGASVSIVYRPFRAIRAHAGLSHNLISLGQRVGVTLTPGWWASPTLSLEYGHFAEGNANPLVRAASGDETFSSAVLERIGYNYGNARLGLELGRKWFTFYLHAGMSRITARVHNLSAETMSETSGTTTVSFSRDPNVRLWTASASLGFVIYLAK